MTRIESNSMSLDTIKRIITKLQVAVSKNKVRTVRKLMKKRTYQEDTAALKIAGEMGHAKSAEVMLTHCFRAGTHMKHVFCEAVKNGPQKYIEFVQTLEKL